MCVRVREQTDGGGGGVGGQGISKSVYVACALTSGATGSLLLLTRLVQVACGKRSNISYQNKKTHRQEADTCVPHKRETAVCVRVCVCVCGIDAPGLERCSGQREQEPT